MAKSYKIRWRQDGKHRQRSFSTKAARDIFKAKRRLEIDVPAESGITFGQFADKWWEDSVGIRGETTRLKDRAVLERHLKPALSQTPVRKLGKSHLLDLRTHLKGKEGKAGRRLTSQTVNDIISLAIVIMSAAKERGIVGDNPWEKTRKLPEIVPAVDFMMPEDKDKLLDFLARRDYPLCELVLVALETGLRRGELQALQRSQLCFVSKQITVDATYSEHLKKRLSQTKSKKVGFVPMTNDVYRGLLNRKLLPRDAYVFDRGIFADLYDRLHRRCKEAGVRPVSMHTFRHTFASLRVMAGVSLATVQKLMRHGSIAMTERYAHLAPGYLAEEIEKGSTRWRTRPIETNAQVTNLIEGNSATPERLELYPPVLRNVV